MVAYVHVPMRVCMYMSNTHACLNLDMSATAGMCVQVCLSMYTYMFIIYSYIYVHNYEQVYTIYMHVYVCIYMHGHECICIYNICNSIWILMHAYVRVCAYTYMYV